MTSNTSTTSTSGVTLMAAIVRAAAAAARPSCRPCYASTPRGAPEVLAGAVGDLVGGHRRGAPVPAHGGDDDVPQRGRLLLDVATPFFWKTL